jgi:hypothetical protein
MVKAQNIVPADFEDIARAAKRAWARETSAAAEWTTKEPELGQCAVTALLVQDAYGGDLTRAQFEAPLSIEGEIERERDYVLSNEATAARYALLKNTVVI